MHACAGASGGSERDALARELHNVEQEVEVLEAAVTAQQQQAEEEEEEEPPDWVGALGSRWVAAYAARVQQCKRGGLHDAACWFCSDALLAARLLALPHKAGIECPH